MDVVIPYSLAQGFANPVLRLTAYSGSRFWEPRQDHRRALRRRPGCLASLRS